MPLIAEPRVEHGMKSAFSNYILQAPLPLSRHFRLLDQGYKGAAAVPVCSSSLHLYFFQAARTHQLYTFPILPEISRLQTPPFAHHGQRLRTRQAMELA
jgi:hypothetical protein